MLGDGAAGGGGAGNASEAAEGGAAAAEEGHAADAAGAGEAEARGEPAAAGHGEPRDAAASGPGEAAAEAVEGREGLRLHHRVVLLLRRLDVPRLGRRRRRHRQDQQGHRRARALARSRRHHASDPAARAAQGRAPPDSPLLAPQRALTGPGKEGNSGGIAQFILAGGSCVACSIAVLVEAVITRHILL